MKIPIPLFKKKPEPEVRRALDVETGLPIPYTPVDWKWRALNALSAVIKYASIADYLDNGKKDNSFQPEGQA